MDRLGQRRVLLPLAVLDAAATATLIALTESGAPTAALVACAVVGGISIPNIGSALRTLWPELLRRRDELLGAAFALDSVYLRLAAALPLGILPAVAAPSIAAMALLIAGFAAGTSLGGSLVEAVDWRVCFVAAAAAGALGALIAYAGRRTLAAPPLAAA